MKDDMTDEAPFHIFAHGTTYYRKDMLRAYTKEGRHNFNALLEIKKTLEKLEDETGVIE